MTNRDLTIVMPTYQGYHWLVDTLPAIRNQEYDGEVHILAVDSSSTDGTPELLKQYDSEVITILQEDFSHGYARNLGVQHAKTEYIVFMSQDALPVGTDWLKNLVAILDDEKIGAAHIQQKPRPNATPLESYFHETMYPDKSKRFTWVEGKPVTLDSLFFSNVCSVTRRSLCLRFPFPENIIMSEDQAFAKNLLQAGYDTYYSGDVAIIHSHHYDLKALFRRHFDSAYSLLDITEDSFSSTAKAGIDYIMGEAWYLFKNRNWGWLMYMPIYELTRIAARLLGARADQLPRRWVLKMSLHRKFWARRDALANVGGSALAQ
jgi:rhamnosyltransferase